MARRTWANINYVECKTYGHAWDEYNDNGRTPMPRGVRYRMTLRCTRCGTTRHDHLDANGDRVGGPRYRKPSGYSDLIGPGEKPTRPQMRLLIIRRR